MYLDTVMNQWIEKDYATIFSFGKMFFSEIEVYVYNNHEEKRHGFTYAACPCIRMKQENKKHIISVRGGILPLKHMLYRRNC